jgi:hypothetical protein
MPLDTGSLLPGGPTVSTRGVGISTRSAQLVGGRHRTRQIPRQCRLALAGKGWCLFMAASPLATVVSGYVNEICIAAGGSVKWLRGSEWDRQDTGWAGGRDAAASAGSARIACIGTVCPAGSCVRRAGIARACAWARAAPAPSARCSRRADGATRATSANGGSYASAARQTARHAISAASRSAPDLDASAPAPETHGLVRTVRHVDQCKHDQRAARRGRQRRAIRRPRHRRDHVLVARQRIDVVA